MEKKLDHVTPTYKLSYWNGLEQQRIFLLLTACRVEHGTLEHDGTGTDAWDKTKSICAHPNACIECVPCLYHVRASFLHQIEIQDVKKVLQHELAETFLFRQKLSLAQKVANSRFFLLFKPEELKN